MIDNQRLSKTTMSTSGKWGLFLLLLLVFSFRADLRFPIGGLLVHPYLLVLPLAILFCNFSVANIPKRVIVPLILFFIVFALACQQNVTPFSEPFKLAASVATFLFFASSVKSEKDFEWMSWGLTLIAVVIGIQAFLISDGAGLTESRLSGINVLEGIGNKNAQSLFTLPGLFFGSFLLINAIAKGKVFRIAVLIICLFFIVISIFLSANRSGWVGLVVIFLSIITVMGLRMRTILFSVIVVLICYLTVREYASDIFEKKKTQTVEGYKSDFGRKLLIIESLKVGLENPIIGVGMDELHREMATRLGLTRFKVESIDTHFLPGYLFGGSGLLSVILFFTFLFRLTSEYLVNQQKLKFIQRARMIVIFYILLFVVRSLFTREILYSPTFISGLGIVFGYYLLQVRKGYFVHGA